MGGTTRIRCRCQLDFVHLSGAGEDVGELSVNCGWGFSAVGFQPRQCNISVGQPQHEVRRFRHVCNFCTKSSLVAMRGPQRLTSLYQSLVHEGPVVTHDNRGRRIKRWYYVDMLAAMDPTVDREDAIISVPEDRRETRDYRHISTQLRGGTHMAKGATVFREAENSLRRWRPVDVSGQVP